MAPGGVLPAAWLFWQVFEGRGCSEKPVWGLVKQWADMPGSSARALLVLPGWAHAIQVVWAWPNWLLGMPQRQPWTTVLSSRRTLLLAQRDTNQMLPLSRECKKVCLHGDWFVFRNVLKAYNQYNISVIGFFFILYLPYTNALYVHEIQHET